MTDKPERPEFKIEASRFTSYSALVREIAHLLDEQDCKLIVLANDEALDRIAAELEGRVILSRLKIVRVKEDEPSVAPAPAADGAL